MTLKEAGFEQVKEKLSSVIKEMEIEAIDNSIVVSFYSSITLALCQHLDHAQTPTQKFKYEFSIFNSQEIGSSLISFEMIFEALQSELLRFDIHSSSLIFPEFSL